MRLVTPAGILTCQTIFHDLFWRFRLNFLTRRCCCSGVWFTHTWKRGLAVMWWATKWAGQNGAQLHLNAFLRKIMGRFMWMVCLLLCRQEAGRGRAAHILQIGIGAMAKDSYQGLGYWVNVAVSLSLGMDLCLKCGVNQQNQWVIQHASTCTFRMYQPLDGWSPYRRLFPKQCGHTEGFLR